MGTAGPTTIRQRVSVAELTFMILADPFTWNGDFIVGSARWPDSDLAHAGPEQPFGPVG